MISKTPAIVDMNIVDTTKLLTQLERSGGFQARNVGIAARILKKAANERKKGKCCIAISFPACIVATGTRGVLKDLARRKAIDLIVTASGTIDHDIARVFASYHAGSFCMNDQELTKQHIHRLGNVLVPFHSYGKTIERFLRKVFLSMPEGKYAGYELVWHVGKKLSEVSKKARTSMIYWFWKNKIPVIMPAPYDSAFGYQLWLAQQERELFLDMKKDEMLMDEFMWNCKKQNKKLCVVCVGGGVSKHHLIWWSQFADGADYAVYITTATQLDGSLSGAETREAISWKKIKQKATHTTIYADATIVLPLLACCLL